MITSSLILTVIVANHNHFLFLLDLDKKMRKTRAEIQKAYRERKRERMGKEAYRKKEASRVRSYYVPVDQLSEKERKTRRKSVAQRVVKHRAFKKRDIQSEYTWSYKWRACFRNLLHPLPTCYSFAFLTSFCNWNSSSLIKYVPIVGYFHLTYCIMFTKWLKVGMSDIQEWTEEVLESNRTLFFCFSLCMFKFYDRIRRQFLQLQNWNVLISSILNSNW